MYNTIRINNLIYTKETIQSLISNCNEDWVKAIVIFLKNWFDDSKFIEVQTSGSTGSPKNIQLLKEHMENSAAMTCRYFGLNEESNALLCLPADYIAGKMMIVRALVSGLNLITVKPCANPFYNINNIIDFAAITPYQFVNSYQSLQESAVKYMIIGGSQVTLKLQKMMERLDIECYETYGMTETCSHIALRKLNGVSISEYFEVLPDVRISIDERSCLVVYATKHTNETLITNDVVELKDENHFKWLGRFDNVINSGGIKIFPEQIEKKLEPFFDRRFFISAIPDATLNEKVILVIEGIAFSKEEFENLNEYIETELTKFEKPKETLFIPAFKTSSSGKILKSSTLKSIL